MRTLVHNLAMFLIIFQIAVLYFWAGYWKVVGAVWQQGVMYYISRINGFHMFGAYAAMMPRCGPSRAKVFSFRSHARRPKTANGNATSMIVVKYDTAVPTNGSAITVFMGLVCFGLIMIGADLVSLTDDDYRSLRSRLQPMLTRAAARVRVRLARAPKPAERLAPKPLTPEGG